MCGSTTESSIGVDQPRECGDPPWAHAGILDVTSGGEGIQNTNGSSAIADPPRREVLDKLQER